MKVDFYGGHWPHYVNFLAPIYNAMPEEHRGEFYALNDGVTRAKHWGIDAKKFRGFRPKQLVCIASMEDYRATRPADVIFVNHGVGQTYGGDQKSAKLGAYSGGEGRDRVVLFLGPSERDAAVSRAAYPDVPAVAIGVPYLDEFGDNQRPPHTGRGGGVIGRESRSVVAISFHAHVNACDETKWAWPFYREVIEQLARSGRYEIIGHAHPRAARKLIPWWEKLGVRYEHDWLEVLRRADVYCIDNSSTGYEAAAIGIPVVWMNAPWYRRDVHHGLRFWDVIPGYAVDEPGQLPMAIETSLWAAKDVRAEAQAVYSGLVDGNAARRASEAIKIAIQGLLPAR